MVPGKTSTSAKWRNAHRASLLAGLSQCPTGGHTNLNRNPTHTFPPRPLLLFALALAPLAVSFLAGFYWNSAAQPRLQTARSCFLGPPEPPCCSGICAWPDLLAHLNPNPSPRNSLSSRHRRPTLAAARPCVLPLPSVIASQFSILSRIAKFCLGFLRPTVSPT